MVEVNKDGKEEKKTQGESNSKLSIFSFTGFLGEELIPSFLDTYAHRMDFMMASRGEEGWGQDMN